MKDITFTIQRNAALAPNVYEMLLKCGEDLPPILGGQFLQFEIPNRPDLPLRRPFCIYKYGKRSVTLIYAVVGAGTEAMAALRNGQAVKCLLPLGNGFILPDTYKRVALIGGGLGCAPLLPVIGNYPGIEFHAYIGFGSALIAKILINEFQTAAKTVKLFTDDGGMGVKGVPTAALDADIEGGLRFDAILTCGPIKLMEAVRNVAVKHNVAAFMTGENRMACGAGACLTCACAVRGDDGAYRNLRACYDGPIFDLTRVELNQA